MAVSHFAFLAAPQRGLSHHCQPGDRALVTGASAGICRLGLEVQVVRRASMHDTSCAAWQTVWVVEDQGGGTFLCADVALTPLMPADGDILDCRLPRQPLRAEASCRRQLVVA